MKTLEKRFEKYGISGVAIWFVEIYVLNVEIFMDKNIYGLKIYLWTKIYIFVD